MRTVSWDNRWISKQQDLATLVSSDHARHQALGDELSLGKKDFSDQDKKKNMEHWNTEREGSPPAIRTDVTAERQLLMRA